MPPVLHVNGASGVATGGGDYLLLQAGINHTNGTGDQKPRTTTRAPRMSRRARGAGPLPSARALGDASGYTGAQPRSTPRPPPPERRVRRRPATSTQAGSEFGGGW